jgi:hypothetical protein
MRFFYRMGGRPSPLGIAILHLLQSSRFIRVTALFPASPLQVISIAFAILELSSA